MKFILDHPIISGLVLLIILTIAAALWVSHTTDKGPPYHIYQGPWSINTEVQP